MSNFRLFSVLILAAATLGAKGQADSLSIIPRPMAMTPGKGFFRFTPGTSIVVAPTDKTWRTATTQFATVFRKASGWGLPVTKGRGGAGQISIVADTSLRKAESYRLDVMTDRIRIRAYDPAGAFYALQTLRQLLPPVIEAGKPVKGQAWKVPCIVIEDAPRYAYRGMHLDVGRHFFPVEYLRQFIDLLAMHKMNRFHWHLTEDQGWRIEIKKYPRLTEVGAWRKETLVGHYNDMPHRYDGKRYGGFYTQEQVKEIVQYAADRFVTIVPEIEMPGHALAALAAYPELGCTGGPYEVGTEWGVIKDVFCPTEKTFQFLEDVLTEVVALFPGQYIHIGGDECPKDTWKESPFCQELIRRENLKDEHGLQSYFITRIEKFLNARGRRLIGWDEILEGGLAPDATVMSWRGTKGGIEAARQGHDVIMTPTSHCYLDYYQSSAPEEPLAIGGFLPLEKVYSYEPTPVELSPAEASHILGVQGNVWTEYMKTADQVSYMAFPRALALAEVGWTAVQGRDYGSFANRLARHLKRFDLLKVPYASHLYEVGFQINGAQQGLSVGLQCRERDAQIRYTTDGSAPNASSVQYKGPLNITANTTVRAVAFKEGKALGRSAARSFTLHKAAGKNIALENPPHPNYSMGGKAALVNGIIGSNDRYGDGEWLGWNGKDCIATLDLGTEQALSKVTLRFFNGPGQWIYLPRTVRLSVSDDGVNYRQVLEQPIASEQTKAVAFPLSLQNVRTRWLKVSVQRYGIIPDGQAGAGNEAWLMVDELVVE